MYRRIKIKEMLADSSGASAIEYALIAALVAVGIINAVSSTGGAVGDTLTTVEECLAGVTDACDNAGGSAGGSDGSSSSSGGGSSGGSGGGGTSSSGESSSGGGEGGNTSSGGNNASSGGGDIRTGTDNGRRQRYGLTL